jgi:glycosyltransferase involved in cell wall biosynthesis
MKLLIVSFAYYPDVVGGGEFSTKMMAEGMVEKGHTVDVLCWAMEDKVEFINGVKVIRKYIPRLSEECMHATKNHKKENLKGYSKYEKLKKKYSDLFYSHKWYIFYKNFIKNGKYDIVHAAAPLSYLGRYNCYKASYDLNIPISYVLRSPALIEFQFFGGKLNNIYRKLNSRAVRLLSGLASPSQYMLDIHNKHGIICDYQKVIRNAVDVDVFNPSLDDIKNKQNIILYAGDIREEKGINTLIKAVDDLNEISLYLVGQGQLSNDIMQTKTVRLIPWIAQNDLYNLMKKAKVVILPSEWEEAFGRILIEGIANGTIAIGSDRGGIPEVLNNDEDFIFEAGNVRDLQNRLNWVLGLSDEDYLTTLNRQQRWMNRYGKEFYCDEWEKFFLQQKGKRK